MELRKRWAPLLLVCATVIVRACGAEERFSRTEESARSELSQHASRASAAAQERDFARAEEEWLKVLALDPRSAQAYHNLGMIYYLEHKYSEAEQALGKALQLDASLVNTRVLLGASLVRQRKSERAIAELERAMKLRLDDSAEKTARVALHEALLARGNYARALEALKPLAQKYPQDVDMLYSLRQTYLLLAEQTFQQIASMDSHSYRIHQILAESLAKQGHYQDAIGEYRQALKLKPDLPGIHYQIGLLYRSYETGPAADRAALQEFEAELKINPYDAPSQYRLGKIYWKWHDLEKALANFRRALDLDESYVSPRLALGRTLEAQGKLEEAQQQLEVAARLEPGNATVHYRLAKLYKQRGHKTAAEQELKKFEEIQAGQQLAKQELEKALRSAAELEGESLDEQER